MVVKTELCTFTEYKIYPGRGMRHVAKDGKLSFFLNAKADALWHQKIKAAKLTWTQAWRRMNKKGKTESGGRRKGRKAAKFQKAIVGMSLDDIKRKKTQKETLRRDAKEEAMKEAKARAVKKAKSGGAVKAPAGKAQKAPAAGKQQKQKGGNAKMMGGAGGRR